VVHPVHTEAVAGQTIDFRCLFLLRLSLFNVSIFPQSLVIV